MEGVTGREGLRWGVGLSPESLDLLLTAHDLSLGFHLKMISWCPLPEAVTKSIRNNVCVQEGLVGPGYNWPRLSLAHCGDKITSIGAKSHVLVFLLLEKGPLANQLKIGQITPGIICPKTRVTGWVWVRGTQGLGPSAQGSKDSWRKLLWG